MKCKFIFDSASPNREVENTYNSIAWALQRSASMEMHKHYDACDLDLKYVGFNEFSVSIHNGVFIGTLILLENKED